jgi:hypothetical protein
MEKREAPMDVSSDVLHIPAQTKMTQEQIAKAVAHHNKHHHSERMTEPGKPAKKFAPGKKIK